jgi:hypothetical protein
VGASRVIQQRRKKQEPLFVAIRKRVHLLEGETFEAFIDQMALRWLMSLRLLHFRMAKWIVEIQMMDFSVLYAAGDGELTAVPYALSRDFVDGQVLFHRSLEVVAEVDDERVNESAVDARRKSQKEAFGDDFG